MENKQTKRIAEILADIKSKHRKKVIIDTDAYNEMDDQFAIVYALCAKDRMDVLSINAAPFDNNNSDSFEDGMLKSYDEICRITACFDDGDKVPVYHGSRVPVEVSGKPDDSPAARNIIDTAMASDEIIYILAIGAITNVASALMLEPAITDRICVIWLGATDLESDNLGEFNLVQDYTAGQILLNSGVPLVLCPAWSVTCVLTCTLPEILELEGVSPAADYLLNLSKRWWIGSGCLTNWYRTIWDIGAPALLLAPDCGEFEIVPAPVFTDARVYAFDSTRHSMIYLKKLDRVKVFADTWRTIRGTR